MQASAHSITPFIIAAMMLGIVAGLVFGPAMVPLGYVGTMYIQLIKGIAVPLVFVSIIDAILSTSLSLRTASRWLMVIVINTTCALVIGLTISNMFRPGDGFVMGSVALSSAQGAALIKQFSLQEFVDTVIPKSIAAPFVENNILSVVLLALLLGAALRSYCNQTHTDLSPDQAKRVSKIVTAIVHKLVLWLVTLVPIAVFCVTARTVGEAGFAPFKGLAVYVGVACLGLLLQIVLVYPWWITKVGKLPLKKFFAAAHRPIAYAFGTNSSLATIPVSLHALDSLGVSKSASRLATCIGTNFNNDGILLYEAMAVLFVAQAFGVELSLGEQIFAALISLAAAIGVAGVPEAGVVSLSLVLGAVGLPLDVLPLLLTVDWIVARMRSVTNVMSDMTVSIAVSELEKR
jgi:DAACS family dicarboxylate/amino acid:cation (Na+ or H+) symporter